MDVPTHAPTGLRGEASKWARPLRAARNPREKTDSDSRFAPGSVGDDCSCRVQGSFAPPGRDRRSEHPFPRVALARRLVRSTRGYTPRPLRGQRPPPPRTRPNPQKCGSNKSGAHVTSPPPQRGTGMLPAALRPNGARECRHGWSEARALAGAAQPVEAIPVSSFLPRRGRGIEPASPGMNRRRRWLPSSARTRSPRSSRYPTSSRRRVCGPLRRPRGRSSTRPSVRRRSRRLAHLPFPRPCVRPT